DPAHVAILERRTNMHHVQALPPRTIEGSERLADTANQVRVDGVRRRLVAFHRVNPVSRQVEHHTWPKLAQHILRGAWLRQVDFDAPSGHAVAFENAPS